MDKLPHKVISFAFFQRAKQKYVDDHQHACETFFAKQCAGITKAKYIEKEFKIFMNFSYFVTFYNKEYAAEEKLEGNFISQELFEIIKREYEEENKSELRKKLLEQEALLNSCLLSCLGTIFKSKNYFSFFFTFS